MLSWCGCLHTGRAASPTRMQTILHIWWLWNFDCPFLYFKIQLQTVETKKCNSDDKNNCYFRKKSRLPAAYIEKNYNFLFIKLILPNWCVFLCFNIQHSRITLNSVSDEKMKMNFTFCRWPNLFCVIHVHVEWEQLNIFIGICTHLRSIKLFMCFKHVPGVHFLYFNRKNVQGKKHAFLVVLFN